MPNPISARQFLVDLITLCREHNAVIMPHLMHGTPETCLSIRIGESWFFLSYINGEEVAWFDPLISPAVPSASPTDGEPT